jgi:predicted deacylase
LTFPKTKDREHKQKHDAQRDFHSLTHSATSSQLVIAQVPDGEQLAITLGVTVKLSSGGTTKVILVPGLLSHSLATVPIGPVAPFIEEVS